MRLACQQVCPPLAFDKHTLETAHMGQLAGRAAIITGAGDGIGRAIARRYAQEGASVLIAEVDETTGMAAAREIAAETGARVEFLRTDVKRKDEVLAMVNTAAQHFGRLDILVNNAWGGGSTCRANIRAVLHFRRNVP
jgi:NAD(P)-dependent dehydrogenase (short-subunit alcohol dehydrogenase family)